MSTTTTARPDPIERHQTTKLRRRIDELHTRLHEYMSTIPDDERSERPDKWDERWETVRTAAQCDDPLSFLRELKKVQDITGRYTNAAWTLDQLNHITFDFPNETRRLDPSKGTWAMRWKTKRRTNPTIYLHFHSLRTLRAKIDDMAPHMLRRCTVYQRVNGTYHPISLRAL